VAALMLAATIGAKALYLLIAWLASSSLAAYLSERKGYGDKPGLASGLLLTVVGAIIWMFIPARDNSDWKLKGPWGDELKSERGKQTDSTPPADAA
jgi:hypothetical protein